MTGLFSADRVIGAVWAVVKFRGGLLQQIGIVVFALLISVFLRYSCAVNYGNIVGHFLVQFESVVNKVLSWLDPLLAWAITLLKLPHPYGHWRMILVCSLFLHLRSVVLEFKVGGDRRTTATLTLLIAVPVGLVGSYIAGLVPLAEGSPIILIIVLTIYLLVEFLRNSMVAYFRRGTESESYLTSFKYYHWLITSSNASIVVVSVLVAIVAGQLGLRGAWILGYILFLVLLGGNMLIASFRLQRRNGGLQSVMSTMKSALANPQNNGKLSYAAVVLDTLKYVVVIMAFGYVTGTKTAELCVIP